MLLQSAQLPPIRSTLASIALILAIASPPSASATRPTAQQAMQEEMGFALAHATKIKTVLEQCGLDPSAIHRVERVIRDYASHLPRQMALQAQTEGEQAAASVLRGDAKAFFCADARQLGGEWASGVEMMRQGF